MNNHKKICRELYAHYTENGICSKCGAAWAEAGHTLCRTCAKKARDREKSVDPTGELKRKRMRDLREKRKAEGLCVTCGAKLKPNWGRVQCSVCLEKGKERDLLRRIRKRIKKGLI